MVMWRADVVCVGRAFPPSSYFLQPMALPKSLFEPRSPLRGTHGDSSSAPGAPGTPGQGAGRAGPGRTAGAQGCMHGGQKGVGVGRGRGAEGCVVGSRRYIAAAARAAKAGALESRARQASGSPSVVMEKAAADDSKEAARGTEPSGIRGGALACTRRGEHKGGVGAHPGEWIEKPRS